MKNRPTTTKAPARALTDLILEQWAATGDVTGLGVLADWLDENGKQPQFATLLREVMHGDHTRIHWFYVRAGYSYLQNSLDREEKRLRNAVELAKAELWVKTDESLIYEWERDYEWEEEGAWCCLLVRESSCGDGREVESSLGGVTFTEELPWRTDYRRVVEAELALEIMDRD